MRTARLIGGTATVVFALAATARANLLTNGSLETTLPITLPDDLVYASPTHNAHALLGWTITNGTIDVVPTGYFAAAAGNFSVDLVGTPGIGGIKQTVTTTPGTAYTLTYDFAVNPERGITIDETGDTKILQVQALNGSTVLATQTQTGTSHGTDGLRTKTNMEYILETFNFTATGASTTLVLKALAPLNIPAGLNANTIYTGPVIDNLDLELSGGGNPTPEPGSLAVLSLGGALLLRRRR